MDEMNEQDYAMNLGASIIALDKVLSDSINPTSMNWDVFIRIAKHFTGAFHATYRLGYERGEEAGYKNARVDNDFDNEEKGE